MKEYLHAIIAIIWVMSLAGTAIGTWKVHSWKDGSDQTHAYQQDLQDVSTKLTQLHKDTQASEAASTTLSGQLDTLQSTTDKLQEGFRHDHAANLVSVNCPNPFTSDFVRELNSDPDASGAQSSAPSGSNGKMH